MFLGGVVSGGVHGDDPAVDGELDRAGDEGDLDIASGVTVAGPVVPAKLIVPLNERGSRRHRTRTRPEYAASNASGRRLRRGIDESMFV